MVDSLHLPLFPFFKKKKKNTGKKQNKVTDLVNKSQMKNGESCNCKTKRDDSLLKGFLKASRKQKINKVTHMETIWETRLGCFGILSIPLEKS